MTKAREFVRVIVPDSHGSEIDPDAARAFLSDLSDLNPKEIVLLGDHVDVGGQFSDHQPSYPEDREYSYYEDIRCANEFLDEIQFRSDAKIHYIEGNHEQRVERWAVRNLEPKDVNGFVSDVGPYAKLKLKKRGVAYYLRRKTYDNLFLPNTIKLGKCYFTHGVTFAKQAAFIHLAKFRSNVVFGHTHRHQAHVEKTVTSEAIGAWCPGTLSKLQPLYMHSTPTEWTNGYAVQFVRPSGNFLHLNVPIVGGVSLLPDVLKKRVR